MCPYPTAWRDLYPLCSDGVANVGSTGPDSILEQIRDYAERSIHMRKTAPSLAEATIAA